MALTSREYRELLTAALPSASDASGGMGARTLFTPAGQRAALDPNVTVVRGRHGAGKTVWFRALLDPQLRQIAADEYQLPELLKVTVHAGWGSESSERYPSADTLGALLERGTDPVDIWWAVVLHVLGVPGVCDLASWAGRAAWVRQNPELWERALAQLDEHAQRENTVGLVLFDALDRLSARREVADQLTTAILQVALDLRLMTRNLRAKVFLRSDMLANLALAFPDSSKLISNSAELAWSRTSLFGLLFHQLGNASCEHAVQFRATTGEWAASTGYRHVLPDDLRVDQDAQQRLFEVLAGRRMGPSQRAGQPYRWLLNQLADGAGQISPRGFLVALRRAAEHSTMQHASHEHALHWESIHHGVRAAAADTAGALTASIPWVGTALAPLDGKYVPIEQSEVTECWRTAGLDAVVERTGEVAGPHDHHPDTLVGELIELGVLTRRTNNRLDMPEIYRAPFRLGRTGRASRVR